MPRLVLAPQALQDIERLTDFLIGSGEASTSATANILIDGLGILKQHPLVGRIAESGLRELLISRGRSGYIALYRYAVASDTVLVLALRHQREGGYA